MKTQIEKVLIESTVRNFRGSLFYLSGAGAPGCPRKFATGGRSRGEIPERRFYR